MPKVKTKKLKKVVVKTINPLNNILSRVYNKGLDAVEKKFGLNNGLTETKRLSTGLLVNDFILGGGLAAGMCTFAGKEASAKSTAAFTVLGACIRSSIPVLMYFDVENAVDPKYTRGILGVKTLVEVFGEKDKKGNYIVEPKCRYSDNNVLENIFTAIATVLRNLPDKVYNKSTEKWYLVFDRKKSQVALMKEMGLKHDKSLYTQTGKYWCEAEPGLQAVFIIDSYPSMVIENVDEGEDEGNALALLAREFSKQLPRVKGRLKRKGAILLGINQLRDAPMVRYGSPEYEPCGHALKFNSDARQKFAGRAVPEGFDRHEKKSDVCVENSVQYPGRKDFYQFKHISNIKNKWGTPFMQGMSRVWIKDGKGKAKGFDPVFDAWEFLNLIGAVEGTRRKPFKINVPKYEKIVFTWDTFKALILAETTRDNTLLKTTMKQLKIKKKLPKLRNSLFRMMENGTAYEMHQNSESKEAEKELDDDIEDLDED